jgi:hypothetical protein
MLALIHVHKHGKREREIGSQLLLLLLRTQVCMFTTQRIHYAHTEHAALPHTATVETTAATTS